MDGDIAVMRKIGPVGSVREFQKAVGRIKPKDDAHVALYRGQSEDKPLLPSLFRRFKGRVHLIPNAEACMLRELRAKIPRRTLLRPDNDWDWLSFAQHYRFPTRLLDWSSDPLIALFFAVEKPGAGSPTVYVYRAGRQNIVNPKVEKNSPFAITVTKIMSPALHSVRVALQRGLHTVHRLHPTKGGGRTMLALGQMEWHQQRLTMISINRSVCDSLRTELKNQGIYRATVYGEFERICDSIASRCRAGTSP